MRSCVGPCSTRPARPQLVALIAVIAAVGSCKSRGPSAPEYFDLHEIGLRIPKLANWSRDAVDGGNSEAGGLTFRLVRDNAIAGSPRLDIVAEPRRAQSTHLEEFLTRNLRDMAELEATGKIRITDIEQHPFTIGPRRAHRVRHEYLLAGTQAAITQLSTFFVLDGRGIAITAVGRTELFSPLAPEIDAMLDGIEVPPEAATPQGASTHPTKPEAIAPIDLGHLGGSPGR